MVPTATRVIEGLVPSSRRDGFPVMAGALPLVGHAVSLHLDAVDVLRRAEVQHGPLAWLSLGLGKWYLFCFGAEGFELLKGKAAAVSGARGSVAYLLGNSLLTMDGAAHRHVREAMNPCLTARGRRDQRISSTHCAYKRELRLSAREAESSREAALARTLTRRLHRARPAPVERARASRAP